VSSENLIVDTENAENYDGDRGRFKRDNTSAGLLSYVSELGFEGVDIHGYVFGLLERESWSLNVTVGNATSTGVDDSILHLRRSNLQEYRVEGGAQDWQRFKVELRFRRRCPSRVSIVLDGPATNNEYPGWGLQLSRVELDQSWFGNCTTECRFNRSECPTSPSHQVVDAAEGFSYVYSVSANMATDSSNADRFFDGDSSRFMRSDNQEGEIVYGATDGVRMLDIEVYQYRPYQTRITVVPYDSDDCQPLELEPRFRAISQNNDDGWIHRIARFDLRELPLCPRRVAVKTSGGENGWELEISRVTLSVMGNLEVTPSLNQRDDDASSDDGDSGGGVKWWMWMCGLIAIFVVCLVAATIVQSAPECCGRDEWGNERFSRLRTLLRLRRNTSDEEEQIRQPAAPPVTPAEPSFTFATAVLPPQ